MYNRGNYKPPKKIVRWTNGAKCTICGQPIMQNQLSKNQFQKDYEMKWNVHWACTQKVTGYLDRNTK